MISHLQELCFLYPNQLWNIQTLSENTSVPWELIHTTMQIWSWNYGSLSKNPHITITIICQYPKHSWNPIIFSANPTFKWLDAHARLPTWRINGCLYAECNRHINLNDLPKPHLNYGYLMKNAMVVPSSISNTNHRKLYDQLQTHCGISKICENPNLTPKFVKITQAEWNYRSLHPHPNFTLEDLKSLNALQTYTPQIFNNPNLTFPLYKHILQCFKCHDSEQVNKLAIEYQYSYFKNPINTTEQLEQIIPHYYTLCSTHKYVDYNPTVTWENIEDEPYHEWNFNKLSSVPFETHSNYRSCELIRELKTLQISLYCAEVNAIAF